MRYERKHRCLEEQHLVAAGVPCAGSQDPNVKLEENLLGEGKRTPHGAIQERVLFGPLCVTPQAWSLYIFSASVKMLPLISLRNDLETKLNFPLTSTTESDSHDSGTRGTHSVS